MGRRRSRLLSRKHVHNHTVLSFRITQRNTSNLNPAVLSLKEKCGLTIEKCYRKMLPSPAGSFRNELENS